LDATAAIAAIEANLRASLVGHTFIAPGRSWYSPARTRRQARR